MSNDYNQILRQKWSPAPPRNLRERCITAATMPLEEGLPRGWSKKSSWSGQIYYCDYLTSEVSRDRPAFRPLYEPLTVSNNDLQTRVVVIVPADEDNSIPECLLVSVQIQPQTEEYPRRTLIPRDQKQAHYAEGYFDALSYTWGDPTVTEEIIVNGHSKQVTTNLAAALRQFRAEASEPVVLWIDAICIDQSSDFEKSAQVPLMPRIYSSAPTVRVWLGPHLWAQPALELIHRACNLGLEYASYIDKACKSSRELQECIQKLGQLPYWTRKWIIQELWLAHEIDIICGPNNTGPIPSDQVSNPTSYILRTALARQAADSISGGHLLKIMEIPSDDTIAALLRIRESRATLPHNSIYAFLFLLSGVIDLTPDYSAPYEEVFIEATAQIIETFQDLRILQQACSHREDFPSWVPMFNESVPNFFQNDRCFSRSTLQYQREGKRLQVNALPVSMVTIVSRTLGGMQLHEKSNAYTPTLDRSAVLEWVSIARTDPRVSDIMDFWHSFAQSDSHTDFNHMVNRARYLYYITDNDTPDEDFREAWESIESWAQDDHTFETVLFVTEEGTYGFAGTDTRVKVGDAVYILERSSLPFCVKVDQALMNGMAVVRLKGTCFMPGMMNGERVRSEAVKRFGDQTRVDEVFEDIIIR